MSEEGVTPQKIVEAHERIRKVLEPTPVFTSSQVDSLVGKNVYFKCENFQKTGSFKARGALNAILSKISHYENVSKYFGCVTHSSGNHGAALAWAAKTQNIPCTVVVPVTTPQVKIDAIRSYNGTVAQCEATPSARVELCDKISREEQRLIIPPYDDYDVMCGQGTIALEFLRQVPDLDAILVPTSGGGMLSGIAVYAKSVKPSIKVFAVEPVGKRLSECLARKERNIWGTDAPPAFLDTRADAIRLQQTGKLTFPVFSKLLEPEDVFTVSDEEMIEATKFVFKRLKMVVELAAGAGVAAVLSSRMRDKYPDLKNVGVVLSGGNIDIEHLPW